MTGSQQDVLLLAKLELPIQGTPVGKLPGLLFTDVLWICAAALTLMLALVIWARYLRKSKPKKRRSHGQKVYRESATLSESEEEAEEEANEMRRRYKYRYKRRGHRSRNPTLAETGGLPPTRSEGPTQSS